MFRSTARNPLRRPSLAAAPARGWLGRLAPLAVVVAALGCDVDAMSPVGADDSHPAQLSADLDEPGTPDSDPIAAECEQRFSCGCEADRFPDVASCDEYYRVEWESIEGGAAEAGLTVDFACYTAALPFATFACDSYTQHWTEEGAPACSFCQNAYGEQQAGEPCQAFVGGMSDCAQGLLCFTPGLGVDAVCIDPCGQAGEGESCAYVGCEAGLTCDWTDATCRVAGGPGQPCADGWCGEGLVCDWQTYTCAQGVGVGESCQNQPCAPELFCGEDLVCAGPAGAGESCLALPCAAGLVCRWDDATCAPPAGAGDDCAAVECAPGLFCDWNTVTCAPPGDVGESCVDFPCADGLQCDYASMTCAPPPGLGQPCYDLCADGLWCDWGLDVPVCAAVPGEGEPCVNGGCAGTLICDAATMLCAPEPPALCGL